jgi:Nucleotidyl transferase AbiEii toxin, Type IV TA system
MNKAIGCRLWEWIVGMECFMLRLEHHQKIEKILLALDAEKLKKAECFLGAGTAISLTLDEYSESVDIDFLCASAQGYSFLRTLVNDDGLDFIFSREKKYKGCVTSNRHGMRAVIDVEDTPVKIEFFIEGRMPISSGGETLCGVPILSRVDLYAEKLLANADRFSDKSVLSRDAIDLAMMISCWGPVPQESIEKTKSVYGADIENSLDKARKLLSDGEYLEHCLVSMKMDLDLANTIRSALDIDLPPCDKDLDGWLRNR